MKRDDVAYRSAAYVLTVICAVLGLEGTLLAFAPSDKKVSFLGYASLALLAVALITYTIQHRRSKLHHLLEELSNSMIVRPLTDIPYDEEHIRNISRLDQEVYTDPRAVRAELFAEWWRKYSRGVYACFASERGLEGLALIGDIEIWPITEPTFRLIVAGTLQNENELLPEMILASPPISGDGFWYVSSVMLVDKYRQKRLCRRMIASAAMNWARSNAKQSRVNVCALGFTAEGEHLAMRLLRLERKAGDGEHPVYAASFTSMADIETIVGGL